MLISLTKEEDAVGKSHSHKIMARKKGSLAAKALNLSICGNHMIFSIKRKRLMGESNEVAALLRGTEANADVLSTIVALRLMCSLVA